MAEKKTKTGKIIRIAESSLVDVIENIVLEAVAHEKKTWIAEQEKKQSALIEEQIEKILKDKYIRKK